MQPIVFAGLGLEQGSVLVGSELLEKNFDFKSEFASVHSKQENTPIGFWWRRSGKKVIAGIFNSSDRRESGVSRRIAGPVFWGWIIEHKLAQEKFAQVVCLLSVFPGMENLRSETNPERWLDNLLEKAAPEREKRRLVENRAQNCSKLANDLLHMYSDLGLSTVFEDKIENKYFGKTLIHRPNNSNSLMDLLETVIRCEPYFIDKTEVVSKLNKRNLSDEFSEIVISKPRRKTGQIVVEV